MELKPTISICFPAYNEAENISLAVADAVDVACRISRDYEIIVVDDGSADDTADIVRDLARENPRIHLVRHETNQGYGAALWTGIQTASHDWVFFTDADLQFRLAELEKLLAFTPEYRVVIGYRAPRRDPVMRLLNAKGWNILNRLLFGLKIRDIDCAFKLFDRRIIRALPLESRGAAMSAEMLIRLSRKGIPIREVPVTHLPRTRGSATGAKPSVIIRAFKELWQLYRGELGREDTTYVQVGKFGVVGAINTGVDVVTYYLLTRLIPFFMSHILMAKFTTFFFGTITSFVLNRRFTFAVRTKLTFAEVLKFYTSIVLTVSINVLSLYVFNTLMGIYDLVAVGLSTVVTFVIGFTFSKLWVFRKKDGSEEPIPSWTPGRFEHPRQIDWNKIARLL